MNNPAMSSVVYRLAEQDDIEALIQTRLLFLADSFHALSPIESENITQQLRQYFPLHLNDDLVIVLACYQEQIISCAFLVIDERPANPSFQTGRVGTILNVYTQPEWRRNGLATKVMNQLLDLAKEQNVTRIQLKAAPDGIPLYEKLGFQAEENDFLNMVLMIPSIGSQ